MNDILQSQTRFERRMTAVGRSVHACWTGCAAADLDVTPGIGFIVPGDPGDRAP